MNDKHLTDIEQRLDELILALRDDDMFRRRIQQERSAGLVSFWLNSLTFWLHNFWCQLFHRCTWEPAPWTPEMGAAHACDVEWHCYDCNECWIEEL